MVDELWSKESPRVHCMFSYWARRRCLAELEINYNGEDQLYWLARSYFTGRASASDSTISSLQNGFAVNNIVQRSSLGLFGKVHVIVQNRGNSLKIIRGLLDVCSTECPIWF